MTPPIEEVSEDDVRCRVCGDSVDLKDYQRFGLCNDCEVEREMAKLPDAPPLPRESRGV